MKGLLKIHPVELGKQRNAVNPTQPGFRPPAPSCTCHLDTDHTELVCVFSKSSQNLLFHPSQFGEFGVLEGQFTEPSGVAVNAQNDIIVADTNNHRIQVGVLIQLHVDGLSIHF